MAKLILDLSGRGGLANKFFGDIDQVTPTPNKRYLIGDSQMAAGIFNPFTRDGYLSPSSNVFHAMTLDQTLAAVMGSAIYDAINDDYYMAERGLQLFKGDGLDDTSLARQLLLTPTGAQFHDLEIYQVNGTRKLFYVYKGKTPTANYTMTTNFSSAVDSFSINGRIAPAGAAEPTLLYSKRGESTGASATQTVTSVAVPAGTNKTMLLVTCTYNTGAATDCTATWDGNAMTQVSSGSGGGVGTDFRWAVFRYIAPATATGSVVVTWNASVTLRLAHILVFDNAHQTTPVAAVGTQVGTAASSVSDDVAIDAEYQLPWASVFSDSATHTLGSSQVEVFNSTNASGNDSFGYFSLDTARLRCGIATLPFASQDNDWLTTTVNGAFKNALSSNYAFMRTADNGYAYIFADNAVHKVDGTTIGGTNGTVSEDVLLFPSYFRLTDGLDYRGNMFMVIHQSTVDTTTATQTNFTVPCGVYIWDRLTTQVKMSDYIPVEGVRVIKKIYVAPSGAVRIICIASDGVTQIRQLDGSTFKVIKELGLGAAPQYPDGLLVAGQKTMWLATNGSLHCHGEMGDGEALAIIGQIRAPQAETTAGYAENITAGALLYGYPSTTTTAGYRGDRQGLTLSYSTGTPVAKKFFPFDVVPISSTDQTAHAGDIYTAVKLLPFLATLQDITIFMAAGTASGSNTAATIKLYFNGSATVGMTKTITRTDVAKGYFNIQVNKPYVSAIQMEIEYPTGVAFSDTYDFHPIYAECIYEPTTTLQPMPKATRGGQ
jgi:hypothetical protein